MPRRYVEEMAWLPCWPPRGQQVSHQREHVTCIPPSSVNKAASPALKPGGDITRSPKQGYQWALKRTDVLQQFLKK